MNIFKKILKVSFFLIKIIFLDLDFEGMFKMLVESLKLTYERLYEHYIYMSSKCILEK